MKDFNAFINKNSISRLWQYNEKYDCGAITAFRNEYNKKENEQRNKSLLSKLVSSGYSVIKLTGKYPEGGVESKETSFFVVDMKDKIMLKADLVRLGQEFEQDSILFIPVGSIQNKTKAYLIGTNENFGIGKTMEFSKTKLGYDSPIYTSYVNGRPFIFEDAEKELISYINGISYLSWSRLAEKDWRDIE